MDYSIIDRFKMFKLKNVSVLLFLIILICSISSSLGVFMGKDIFKYVSAISQIVSVLLSFRIIYMVKSRVKWINALLIIFVLSGFPLLRIYLDVSEMGFAFKTITDGFFALGGYYFLIFTGFSLSLLIYEPSFLRFLNFYAVLSIPIAITGVVIGMALFSDRSILVGHIMITNFLLPTSLLVFYPQNRKGLFLGFIAIVLILFIASRIWSRSYTLVGFYLLFFALSFLLKGKNKFWGIVFVVFIFGGYKLGAFDFLFQESMIRNTSVIEKYKISSLLDQINNYFKTGDFYSLFYWEGNSRAGILVDAFGNFTSTEWFWGRGIFGTYVSFIKRSTIEMGWAQELFRWGAYYIAITLMLLIVSYKKLGLLYKKNKYPMLKMLQIVVLIKFLDGFVYGIAEFSMYSLLMFVGIMILAVKNNRENIKFV